MWMKSLGVDLFMTRTVHEFLWGFKDPLMSRLHALKPEVDEYFGLMYKVRVCLGIQTSLNTIDYMKCKPEEFLSYAALAFSGKCLMSSRSL